MKMTCEAIKKCDSIRLEIVRLCHRHDLEPVRIIERAKEIEAYVLGVETEAHPTRKRRAKVDNLGDVT